MSTSWSGEGSSEQQQLLWPCCQARLARSPGRARTTGSSNSCTVPNLTQLGRLQQPSFADRHDPVVHLPLRQARIAEAYLMVISYRKSERRTLLEARNPAGETRRQDQLSPARTSHSATQPCDDD